MKKNKQQKVMTQTKLKKVTVSKKLANKIKNTILTQVSKGVFSS